MGGVKINSGNNIKQTTIEKAFGTQEGKRKEQIAKTIAERHLSDPEFKKDAATYNDKPTNKVVDTGEVISNIGLSFGAINAATTGRISNLVLNRSWRAVVATPGAVGSAINYVTGKKAEDTSVGLPVVQDPELTAGRALTSKIMNGVAQNPRIQRALQERVLGAEGTDEELAGRWADDSQFINANLSPRAAQILAMSEDFSELMGKVEKVTNKGIATAYVGHVFGHGPTAAKTDAIVALFAGAMARYEAAQGFEQELRDMTGKGPGAIADNASQTHNSETRTMRTAASATLHTLFTNRFSANRQKTTDEAEFHGAPVYEVAAFDKGAAAEVCDTLLMNAGLPARPVNALGKLVTRVGKKMDGTELTKEQLATKLLKGQKASSDNQNMMAMLMPGDDTITLSKGKKFGDTQTVTVPFKIYESDSKVRTALAVAFSGMNADQKNLIRNAIGAQGADLLIRVGGEEHAEAITGPAIDAMHIDEVRHPTGHTVERLYASGINYANDRYRDDGADGIGRSALVEGKPFVQHLAARSPYEFFSKSNPEIATILNTIFNNIEDAQGQPLSPLQLKELVRGGIANYNVKTNLRDAQRSYQREPESLMGPFAETLQGASQALLAQLVITGTFLEQVPVLGKAGESWTEWPTYLQIVSNGATQTYFGMKDDEANQMALVQAKMTAAGFKYNSETKKTHPVVSMRVKQAQKNVLHYSLPAQVVGFGVALPLTLKGINPGADVGMGTGLAALNQIINGKMIADEMYASGVLLRTLEIEDRLTTPMAETLKQRGERVRTKAVRNVTGSTPNESALFAFPVGSAIVGGIQAINFIGFPFQDLVMNGMASGLAASAEGLFGAGWMKWKAATLDAQQEGLHRVHAFEAVSRNKAARANGGSIDGAQDRTLRDDSAKLENGQRESIWDSMFRGETRMFGFRKKVATGAAPQKGDYAGFGASVKYKAASLWDSATTDRRFSDFVSNNMPLETGKGMFEPYNMGTALTGAGHTMLASTLAGMPRITEIEEDEIQVAGPSNSQDLAKPAKAVLTGEDMV